jgi:tetratricopeptide (TPR) repeat protein
MIDEQTTLIIVSDHGFHWGDGRPAAPADPHTATAVWWHRPEGVFVAAGRGVRPGSVGRVRPVDIFPTILSLLGLPLDPAFQGSPLGWCLDDEVEGRAARRRPVDYQSLVVMERAAPTDLPAHEKRAVEAKLRALGYLDSSPSESDLVTARRLNNLGTSLLESGRSDEAEQSYREAIAIAPDYAAPYYNLMLLVFQRGAYDEAEQLFWSASERGLRERERAVVDFALAYLEKNERSRALGLLAEGRRRYPKSYTVTVNSGTVYANLGEFDEAAAEFRRAIELDPDSVVARNNLALILLRTGDQPDRVLEGRQLLMESLSIDPNQPEIREFLESRSSSNVR